MRRQAHQHSSISSSLISKVAVILTTSFYIFNYSYNSTAKDIVFTRYIWTPMLIITSLLLITSLVSLWLTGQKQEFEENSKFVFGDVFVLTTIDKLLTIGFNIHLIIFFISRNDIDFAYMIFPVLVCFYYILDSTIVVAYLDTVYFNVVEWQHKILSLWSIRDVQTNLHCQLVICMFFYHKYESMTVHFTRPVYQSNNF